MDPGDNWTEIINIINIEICQIFVLTNPKRLNESRSLGSPLVHNKPKTFNNAL